MDIHSIRYLGHIRLPCSPNPDAQIFLIKSAVIIILFSSKFLLNFKWKNSKACLKLPIYQLLSNLSHSIYFSFFCFVLFVCSKKERELYHFNFQFQRYTILFQFGNKNISLNALKFICFFFIRAHREKRETKIKILIKPKINSFFFLHHLLDI